MSKTVGKLLKCDRCGASVFLAEIGISDMDGLGISIPVPVYDEPKEKWGYYEEIGDLCPNCYKEFEKAFEDFVKKLDEDVEEINEILAAGEEALL